MKIPYIDELIEHKTEVTFIKKGVKVSYWAVAEPIEGFGFIKWKNRGVQAIAILTGKAKAVRFYK